MLPVCYNYISNFHCLEISAFAFIPKHNKYVTDKRKVKQKTTTMATIEI